MNETLRRVTGWGMVVITAAIIGWDVYLGIAHADTESMILASTGRRFMALPLFAGSLVGHWFLNRRSVNYKLWPVALSILLATLAWDIVNVYFPAGTWVQEWIRYPGFWLLAGLPVGSFFWPQRRP